MCGNYCKTGTVVTDLEHSNSKKKYQREGTLLYQNLNLKTRIFMKQWRVVRGEFSSEAAKLFASPGLHAVH